MGLRNFPNEADFQFRARFLFLEQTDAPRAEARFGDESGFLGFSKLF